MRNITQDVRFALRTFKRRPGFTAAVIATLALGIGANAAIFSVANAVLLQRLPFKDPDAPGHGVGGRRGHGLPAQRRVASGLLRRRDGGARARGRGRARATRRSTSSATASRSLSAARR